MPYDDFVGRVQERQVLHDWIAQPEGGCLIVTAPPGTGKSYLLGKLADELGADKKRVVVKPPLGNDPPPIHLGYLALALEKQAHPLLDAHAKRAWRDALLEVLGGAADMLAEAEGAPKASKAIGVAADHALERRLEKMQASDYPVLLECSLKEAAVVAKKRDARVVCILDPEKHLGNEAFQQALHQVLCTIPDRVKLILGVREGDPVLQSGLMALPCLAYSDHPHPGDDLGLLWPLGDLSFEEAEALVRERLGELATPEVVVLIRERCGRLALAVDAGIKVVQALGAGASAALEGLPSRNHAQATHNLMSTLARRAVRAPAPGADLVKLLTLAREPLSRSDLSEALGHLGKPVGAGDLVAPLGTLDVANCLRRVRLDEEDHYEPYHDWMREALRQQMSGDREEIALLHRALGRLYASRLVGEELPRSAVEYAPYHLCRGPLRGAEDQQRFVDVAMDTHVSKRNWGLVEDVREEMTQAARIVDQDAAVYSPQDRGIVHNGLGTVLILLREPKQALAHFRAAVDIAESLPDAEGGDLAAATLGNMGNICTTQGQLEAALRYYQRALSIAQRTNNRQFTANALGSIANIHHRQGRAGLALRLSQEAYEIAECLGNPLTMATALGKMGMICAEQGDTDKALQHLRRALELYGRHGLRPPGREIVARKIARLTGGETAQQGDG